MTDLVTTISDERLAEMIIAAYRRGHAWCLENPGSEEYLAKAAYDYADKALSSLEASPAAAGYTAEDGLRRVREIALQSEAAPLSMGEIIKVVDMALAEKTPFPDWLTAGEASPAPVSEEIEADRARLIHILVVHFDMFRHKAEEAADLFLHHKTLAAKGGQ